MSKGAFLGVSTAAYYGRMETEEAAAEIACLGCACAEVFLQTTSEYTESFARTVKHSLSGVRCTSVHAQGTQFENFMFSRSPRQRADAWDCWRRVMDAAAVLEAPRYVYHGRHTALLMPLPFEPERNAEVVARMCEEAGRRGIMIAWENVSWCQLTTPERVTAMRRLVPQARFTLDIKQAMRAGRDAFDFMPAMGDALCNVHLCDWDETGRLCMPGTGIFPFDELFRKLAGQGYAGPLILEPYGDLVTSRDVMRGTIRRMDALMA